MVYKARTWRSSTPDILNIPLTSFSTFILLDSSLLMVLALAGLPAQRQILGHLLAVRHGALRTASSWAARCMSSLTSGSQGCMFNTNLFSQCFYTLVGFHGFHVFIGVMWLLVMAFAGLMGKIDSKRSIAVEICGLVLAFRRYRLGGHLHPDLPDEDSETRMSDHAIEHVHGGARASSCACRVASSDGRRASDNRGGADGTDGG